MIRVTRLGTREALRELRATQRIATQAYYSAVNRVAQRVKTEAAREVRKKYHIRAKDVNNNVTLRRGSASDRSAEIRWKGKNIPIIKFRSNPNKPRLPHTAPPRVLKAAVKRSGLKPIKGAFIAKVGSAGHVGVFKRAGRRRLPIEEIFGPAVPVMINEPNIVEHLRETAITEFDKRLEHELNRRLGGNT